MSTNTQDKPCNCFKETLKLLESHYLENGRVPKDAIEVDFRWRGQGFLLSKGDFAPVNPTVVIKYRAPKKGGGHVKNKTKSEVSMMATHCCFCGRKYQQND